MLEGSEDLLFEDSLNWQQAWDGTHPGLDGQLGSYDTDVGEVGLLLASEHRCIAIAKHAGSHARLSRRFLTCGRPLHSD